MKKPKGNIKKKLNKTIKGAVRDKAKNDGYYDGRFRTREIADKKKSADKLACRKFRVNRSTN